MKTTPALQRFVTELAARHDVDLSRTGAYLRLQLEGHGHLVLENIGASRVSVTHYVPASLELVADPQVVFFTEYRPPAANEPQWAPLEITQVFGGWTLYAELDEFGEFLVYDLTGQYELATFCEQVLARNLTAYGWLESAVRSNLARQPWSEEEILARGIRFDEMSIGSYKGRYSE